ncbi:hypothetical protein QQF64_009702 [Cirrhinus molitorella]|uniref:Uncharacterized protein n=1 Tax=Cirrhinus molitorella TaxID=172907 RepID=A0ABR3M2S5_9TELE
MRANANKPLHRCARKGSEEEDNKGKAHTERQEHGCHHFPESSQNERNTKPAETSRPARLGACILATRHGFHMLQGERGPQGGANHLSASS